MILSGCSVSAFSQTGNSAPNDGKSRNSYTIEEFKTTYPFEIFVPKKSYVYKIPPCFRSAECSVFFREKEFIIIAEDGDTVETIAKRYGCDPFEVAAFNGLHVNTKLKAGREIKMPIEYIRIDPKDLST